jgi:hypothetical protein
MVKALNQLFNAILSFGTRNKLHGSKFDMQGRTFILFLATNLRTDKVQLAAVLSRGETNTPNF